MVWLFSIVLLFISDFLGERLAKSLVHFPSFDGKLEKTLCLDAHEGNGIADWPLVISVKFFLARGVPSRCQSYPWRFCEFIYF